jgi:hypothetical protein
VLYNEGDPIMDTKHAQQQKTRHRRIGKTSSTLLTSTYFSQGFNEVDKCIQMVESGWTNIIERWPERLSENKKQLRGPLNE